MHAVLDSFFFLKSNLKTYWGHQIFRQKKKLKIQQLKLEKKISNQTN